MDRYILDSTPLFLFFSPWFLESREKKGAGRLPVVKMFCAKAKVSGFRAEAN